MGAESLLAVGLGTQVAGTVARVGAAKQEAESAEVMHKYNAMVAEREAASVRRANIDEQIIRRKEAGKFTKRQRVLYAKSGVRLEGSPTEVLLASIIASEEDIILMARERDLEAGRYAAQAAQSWYRADAAKEAGKTNVATAVLGGVSNMFGTYMNYKLLREGTPSKVTSPKSYLKSSSKKYKKPIYRAH